MKKAVLSLIAAATLAGAAEPIPENLVVEDVPPVSAELREEAGRYLEFRGAGFNGWHPQRREVLISTRFADSSQLHLVRMPGGARRQLTFFDEPVAGGAFRPKSGEFIVFLQDTGGGEFYQIHRFDIADAKVTLLTDGKSRNIGARWSKSGKWLAYTSTRRTGRDNDIYIMDPSDPKSDRMAFEVSGGGWSVLDWSPDESRLLVGRFVSINEAYLYVADAAAGSMELLTPETGGKVAYLGGQFSGDGRSVFTTSDKNSKFQRLVRIDLESRVENVISGEISWGVDDFDLSPDGRILAFTTNEDGVSVLHLLEVESGRKLAGPELPMGVISRLGWHENSRDLAFNFSYARSTSDVFSFDVKTGEVERWTESETGGLDPAAFVEPELVRTASFDGLPVSSFVYRPDPAKFQGKRPVLISIHGGPESQSRPVFQGRLNYFLNEMGIAMVVPNVRGSSGYGKTFLTLDNGYKREDSVRDIGAVIDWIRNQTEFDSERVAVIGGSYGGYMVLASMVHYGDRLAAGIDIVGISNFVTFLENTQDYRRDLRREEYGDERDPKMRAFLEGISPANQADKIRRPLLVVQGMNDPRVPVTEAEQMVRAIRGHGGTVGYLMAKDEGHGFAKKRNADFQFLSTIMFLREHLLN